MNKADKELYDNKINAVEDSMDLKFGYVREDIQEIRDMLKQELIPLTKKTHEQTIKTNGRVTKLEEFKKNVSKTVTVLNEELRGFKQELDIVSFFSRHQKITLSVASILYIGLFAGLVFSEKLNKLVEIIF